MIEYFAQHHTVCIFAYGESLRFYTNHFANHSHITVCEVSVPFYVGNKDGVDYEATKALPQNQKDHDGINQSAKRIMQEVIGVPDLVISDYEPTVAEVAYQYDVPLITIDQQSKYLHGVFPKEIDGSGYVDEVERLQLFFPEAATRIACSFFNVMKKTDGMDVMMVAPVLKESIVHLSRDTADTNNVLVYISSQQTFRQTSTEIAQICSLFPEYTFYIFTAQITEVSEFENVVLYQHGDGRFLEILGRCRGVITTAGHTLLSEAMYLGVPVYALPLDIYEQQMNAKVITDNAFGIQDTKVTKETLEVYLENLAVYTENIAKDTRILLKGDGMQQIISFIEAKYMQ